MSTRLSDIRGAMKTDFNTITEFQNKVYWWRSEPLQRDNVPALLLMDGENETTQEKEVTRHTVQVRCEVVATVGSGQSAATVEAVEGLMQKVLDKVRTNPTWGGLADNTLFMGSSFIVNTGSLTLAGGFLDFEVEYTTEGYKL